MNYKFSVTRDGKAFTGYKYFEYNGTEIRSVDKNVAKSQVNTKVTTATIILSDGTRVPATVKYTERSM